MNGTKIIIARLAKGLLMKIKKRVLIAVNYWNGNEVSAEKPPRKERENDGKHKFIP